MYTEAVNPHDVHDSETGVLFTSLTGNVGSLWETGHADGDLSLEASEAEWNAQCEDPGKAVT